jgi:hypothetical protein
MYTLLQAINLPELENKWLKIVDGGTLEAVVVKGSAKTYKQMMCELRDWNHPCHKPRHSAVSFIKEWTKAYS